MLGKSHTRPQGISAGHEVTWSVARDILDAGGNAYDAAIGAYMTMFVTEPCMASLGAGGFANILTSQKKNWIIDFFCQTPSQYHKNAGHLLPIEVDFGTATETFYIGMASSAVPGAIAFIYSLHDELGNMPIKELFAPARELARKGIPLNDFQAFDVQLLNGIIGLTNEGRSIFFNGESPKHKGDIVRMNGYADLLDTLIIEGPDLVYKGEIAKQVEKDMISRGGHLRRRDFENYKVKVIKPHHVSYHGYDVQLPCENSIGGLVALSVISHLCSDEVDEAWHVSDYSGHWIRVIEEVKSLNNDPEKLLAYLQSYGIEARVNKSTMFKRGTSHFNIADKNGNAIALTTSIGEGNGYFIPGTDMQLNNMLGETFLLPGGLNSWEEASRLNSMMCPVIMHRDDEIILMGSGGAGRIPYMISQVMNYYCCQGISLREAVEAPRLYPEGNTINIEKGLTYDTTYNSRVKIWHEPSLYFGGVHCLAQTSNSVEEVGDFRRQGCP